MTLGVVQIATAPRLFKVRFVTRLSSAHDDWLHVRYMFEDEIKRIFSIDQAAGLTIEVRTIAVQWLSSTSVDTEVTVAELSTATDKVAKLRLQAANNDGSAVVGGICDAHSCSNLYKAYGASNWMCAGSAPHYDLMSESGGSHTYLSCKEICDRQTQCISFRQDETKHEGCYASSTCTQTSNAASTDKILYIKVEKTTSGSVAYQPFGNIDWTCSQMTDFNLRSESVGYTYLTCKAFCDSNSACISFTNGNNHEGCYASSICTQTLGAVPIGHICERCLHIGW